MAGSPGVPALGWFYPGVMAMRIRKSNLASAGLITQHLINANHWGPRIRSARIFDRWPQIVGADAAKHTQPVRLLGGVLRIEATDTNWVTSMHFMEPQVVAQANRELGEPLVNRISVYVKR